MSDREPGPYLVDAVGRRLSLARPITSLGRSPGCEVYIADRRASRRHAEIEWDGETCTVRDLGSDNGTTINGRRLTAPADLADGDEITIAGAVFLFRDPEATLSDGGRPLLVVDPATGEVWIDRRPVALSAKERLLFDLLYRYAGRPCSKQEIAEAVWPEYRAEVYDYQIESLVKRLREKLEPDPRRPMMLLTVHGRGYRLDV